MYVHEVRYHMARSSSERPMSQCRGCGFEAASGGDEWAAVSSPPFRTVTQCPECGSTDVVTGL